MEPRIHIALVNTNPRIAALFAIILCMDGFITEVLSADEIHIENYHCVLIEPGRDVVLHPLLLRCAEQCVPLVITTQYLECQRYALEHHIEFVTYPVLQGNITDALRNAINRARGVIHMHEMSPMH